MQKKNNPYTKQDNLYKRTKRAGVFFRDPYESTEGPITVAHLVCEYQHAQPGGYTLPPHQSTSQAEVDSDACS